MTTEKAFDNNEALRVGTARVVWRVGFSLPIVQCVRVRRAGDAISGFQVELVAITPRIHTDANCPSHV